MAVAEADVDWLLEACPHLHTVHLPKAPGVDAKASARLHGALLGRRPDAPGNHD